jgi:uncharacterized caspase-like protein
LRLSAEVSGHPRCLPRQSIRQEDEADDRAARGRPGARQGRAGSPNTLIAFAARAGSTASDGDSKNSPFASALAERLATPGLDLRKAFGYVRDDVLNRQEPFIYGSLGGDDMTLVRATNA